MRLSAGFRLILPPLLGAICLAVGLFSLHLTQQDQVAQAADSPISCDNHPPDPLTHTLSACGIYHTVSPIDGDMQIEVVFAGISSSGCVPRLKSVVVSGTTIALELDATLPPDVVCTGAIRPYTLTSDPMPLAAGDWEVLATKTDNSGNQVYSGSFSHFVQTYYFPIVLN